MDSGRKNRNASNIFASQTSFDKNVVRSTQKAKREILNPSKNKAKVIKKMGNKLSSTLGQAPVPIHHANNSKDRDNKFVDSRKANATESEIRLALYRQKKQKAQQGKGKYQLGDETNTYGQSLDGGNNDDDDGITHGGKPLHAIPREQLERFDSDSEDESKMDKTETLTHFGGGALLGEQLWLAGGLPREEFLKLSLADRRKFMIQHQRLKRAQRGGQKAEMEKELGELDDLFKEFSHDLFSEHRLRPRENMDDQLIARDNNNDTLDDIDSYDNIDDTRNSKELIEQLMKRYNIDMDNSDSILGISNQSKQFSKKDDDEDDEDEDDEDEDEDDEEPIDPALLSSLLKKNQTDNQADDDDDDDDEYDNLGVDPAAPKLRIGLDGKAIVPSSSSSTTTGTFSIGSDTSRDDYSKQTLLLQNHARGSAADRAVSDQDKATRHRQHLLRLEERRQRRKAGEDLSDDEQSAQYEEEYMKDKNSKAQQRKDDDDLIAMAMMEDFSDASEKKRAISLLNASKSSQDGSDDDDDDEDDEDEDDYDEDDSELDEDDIIFTDDDENDSNSKSTKQSQQLKTKKSDAAIMSRSGDALDDGYILDAKYTHQDIDDDEEYHKGVDIDDVQFGTRAIASSENAAEERKQRKKQLGFIIRDIEQLFGKNKYNKLQLYLNDELPYSYEFPAKYKGFENMLNSHIEPIMAKYTTLLDHDEQLMLPYHILYSKILNLIISRIIQLYHPRISSTNTTIIEALYRYLWRYFKEICLKYTPSTTVDVVKSSSSSKASKKGSTTTESKPSNFALIISQSDVITHHLFVIDELMPRYTGKACIGLLELFVSGTKQYNNNTSILHSTGIDQYDINTRYIDVPSIYGIQNVLTYPDNHELYAYRLLMQLYPLSDYRHTIMTPLQLLLCKTLTLCRVQSPSHIISSLFIASCLIELWSAQERIIPELYAYINSICTFLYQIALRNSTIMDKDNKDANKDANATKTTSNGYYQASLLTPILSIFNSIALQVDYTLPSEYTSCDKASSMSSTSASRSVGVLPLEWMYNTNMHTCVLSSSLYMPYTEYALYQYNISPYMYHILLNTVSNMLSTISRISKDQLSMNEALRPAYDNINNAYILERSILEYQHKRKHQDMMSSTASSNDNNKKNKKQTNQQYVQLPLVLPPLLSSIPSTLQRIKQYIDASLIDRKPLTTYAKAVEVRALEPKLDESYIDSKANTFVKQREERKRLEAKLSKQSKTMQRDIRKQALSDVMAKQSQIRAKEEQRKSQLARQRSTFEAEKTDSNLLYNKNFNKNKRVKR